jgi:myo-inositol-hexaphosphate 3-phosphohydrolase
MSKKSDKILEKVATILNIVADHIEKQAAKEKEEAKKVIEEIKRAGVDGSAIKVIEKNPEIAKIISKLKESSAIPKIADINSQDGPPNINEDPDEKFINWIIS